MGSQRLTSSIALVVSHKTFMYKEMKMTTDGFSDSSFLNEGDFGLIHKRVLPSKELVAIKQLEAISWQEKRVF